MKRFLLLAVLAAGTASHLHAEEPEIPDRSFRVGEVGSNFDDAFLTVLAASYRF